MNKQRGSTSGPTADAPQGACFPQGKGASGATSSGSQRPPEPAQPHGGKTEGSKGGKSSKGKESSKGKSKDKSKDKSKGKSKGKNCSDSESESSSYGPVTRHRPRLFDPVRHVCVELLPDHSCLTCQTWRVQ